MGKYSEEDVTWSSIEKYIDYNNVVEKIIWIINNINNYNIDIYDSFIKIGKLEYENQFGAMKTDYTMLKAGLLQKANGGYIMFQARDLLTNPQCYETLKKVLLVKEIGVENGLEQRSSMMLISLKPEPIPLDVKVILLGKEKY